MSMHFKEFGESYTPGVTLSKDKDGKIKRTLVERTRAKQAFKDECDINRIVDRMAKTGMVSHLSRFKGQYGDFTDYPDLLEAQQRLARGVQIFDELPIEIKREFGNDPRSFFTFVNDPANADKLEEVLPQLAAPGRQRQANPVMREAASSPSGADPVPASIAPASNGDSSSGEA